MRTHRQIQSGEQESNQDQRKKNLAIHPDGGDQKFEKDQAPKIKLVRKVSRPEISET
jgi:hypothetical protein